MTGTLELDGHFWAALPELAIEWQASPVSEPELVVANHELAAELGIDPAWLASPAGVALLVGHEVPPGSTPIAMAYAGHQFGGYSPRLGDGRALLLGEVVDADGNRRDLHLKGSGRTPFARGGDGLAALGPMLREYLMAEAMFALGIPTSRALAVVATGDEVCREQGLLPGAVLARVAASHLRVGTFELAARSGGPDLVRRLADYALARHHPDLLDAPEPYLGLFEAVVDAQASLVAQWMAVGFIHGVMNTDNMTISGETIDYGPCAFLDRFDPATVFSSIDHGGRYAYGNQPAVAAWNLARLAETLLSLIHADQDAAVEAATAILDTFADRFRGHWSSLMSAKLGLVEPSADEGLVDDWLTLLHHQRLDLTTSHRSLADWQRGEQEPLGAQVIDRAQLDAWIARWEASLDAEGRDPQVIAASMDRVNPAYIPRNHLVEEALDAATSGDLVPFRHLLEVVTDPYVTQEGRERFAAPAPEAFTETHRTFCGT